jgi:hypothetical protein
VAGWATSVAHLYTPASNQSPFFAKAA